MSSCRRWLTRTAKRTVLRPYCRSSMRTGRLWRPYFCRRSRGPSQWPACSSVSRDTAATSKADRINQSRNWPLELLLSPLTRRSQLQRWPPLSCWHRWLRHRWLGWACPFFLPYALSLPFVRGSLCRRPWRSLWRWLFGEWFSFLWRRWLSPRWLDFCCRIRVCRSSNFLWIIPTIVYFWPRCHFRWVCRRGRCFRLFIIYPLSAWWTLFLRFEANRSSRQRNPVICLIFLLLQSA